jgi:hypothetical protein
MIIQDVYVETANDRLNSIPIIEDGVISARELTNTQNELQYSAQWFRQDALVIIDEMAVSRGPLVSAVGSISTYGR